MYKRQRSRFKSANIPELNINERFLEACAIGDYQTVNIILNSIKNFNINITDNLGRCGIRIAVTNENIEVVQALLPKTDSYKLREALLYAIYLGHTQIAEIILRHPQYKVFNDKKFVKGASDSFWQATNSDDAQFAPDITPIMLASQYNRTDIVQMLLINGDRIERPHEFFCKCNECSNRFEFDSLRHAQSRLNAYRGLASESYISLTSIDPILTAFEMGRELRILAEREKYFKAEYLHLAEKLSEYSVKLLNYVRGRDELEIVLNKTGKEDEETFQVLARLDLALQYQEMPFVAHPNCQQKLVEIWFSGIRRITKMNQVFSMLSYLAIFLCIPFLSILYIVAPQTKVGSFLKQPCIKFISFVSSYLVLVSIIIISSLQFAREETERPRFSTHYPAYFDNFTRYTQNEKLKYRFEASDFYIRFNKPNVLDIIICIWLFGFIINEVKQIKASGIRSYLRSWNNIVNIIIYILFFASYALKYYSMIIVNIQINTLNSLDFWSTLNNLNKDDIDTQSKIFQTFYWLNEDRFYWFSYDPINISEGLFAIATTFSFSKLCFFLPANQALGPLQITLGRMISDVMKFVCIFLIIFTGFLFGLNNLFWYYQSDIRNNFEIEPHLQHERGLLNAEIFFGKIDKTFRTMFWSLFLIGNNQAVLVEPFKNELTLVIGYLVFGFYHISSLTVLLNMLIAMMARSYETILDDSDTEWKFARSKLYMEFIKENSILPSPFNIMPDTLTLTTFFKWFLDCFFKTKNENNSASKSNSMIEMSQFRVNGKSSVLENGDLRKSNMNGHANGNKKRKFEKRRGSFDEDNLTYKKVMERVVKRFLLHNNRENEELRESDFDELKQDLRIIRLEMFNDLKRVKEELTQNITIIHNGVSIVGGYVFEESDSVSELTSEFDDFKTYENKLNEELGISENSFNESNNSRKNSINSRNDVGTHDLKNNHEISKIEEEISDVIDHKDHLFDEPEKSIANLNAIVFAEEEN